MIWQLIAILILLLFAFTLVILFRVVLKNRKRRSYKHDILLITIPKYADLGSKQEIPIKERLSQVENLFASLASTRAERGIEPYFTGRSDHFALEMVSHDGSIGFYAALPPQATEFFIQQTQAVYPHAHFERVSDYNIFQPHAAVLSGHLVFRRHFIFPLKTYRSFDHDPMDAVMSALSKIPRDSGATIQFVIRSARKEWHAEGRRISKEAYRTSSLQEALKSAKSKSGSSVVFHALGSTARVVGSTFVSTPKKDKEKIPTMQQHTLTPQEQEAVKAIEEKNNKGGFDVNIRIIVSAPDSQHAEAHLRNIMNAFGQYNSYEFGNAFKPLFHHSHDKIVNDFIYRYFNPAASLLLNSEEMVSLFHLPERTTVSNVLWQKARSAPPPMEMPTEGILFGHSVYQGATVEVRMKDTDRQRHVYMIGQTGTGKSNLLESLAVQDIKRGAGVCVIDPHGDLVDHILGNVPPERYKDVIIFDPSDTDRPLALNMMEFTTPEQKTFVINEMIYIFDKLYDLKTTGGPMFEQYMRNTMLLMMEDPASGSTLLEIPRVLADEKFRRYKLTMTKNPVVRDFWEKEAHKAGGDASLANMVPYITSKLNQFIANDIMRPIIAQQNSSFNFRDVMDSQKILLINLSKGRIGDLNSMLLGMICVGKLLMAALSRVDVEKELRKDFYLYIDEFQNFVTESIAVILSEARKYKLNLTMAHQYINQLVKNNNTNVKDAVFGNVGTIIAFRVGVDDAEPIAQQFAPVFDKFDVMNIEKYHCYIRLLIDNQNPPAFSFKPTRPPAGNRAVAQLLREQSRLRYGRPRTELEKEIFTRTSIPAAPAPLPPIA
ncbi:MAG: hypothetical protein A3B30_03815 [Candidatus Komeilibacteria bacterium RIFCSPLOWO2_01_FULL_52_15]|uniref:Uncharacterized protein n=1 Tax=Candidatus Komeilibacteria bacterium RIFCSPLOWO2_01_FULL_52_15 TaxID=1798551 RepID=A0A1G2BR19_9BACT|nr:MAG: hypothetical protein A3B30_03815 [Candidatus Komeilibacteria bacterium RIFCSPLOWO2_01_FULL_52_15]